MKRLLGLAFADTRGRPQPPWSVLGPSLGESRERIVRGVSKTCHFFFIRRSTENRGLDQARDFLNSRRRILPDAVLGTAFTKWTSRGCL